MELRTKDHPEANGRQPQVGEIAWTLRIPLESGEELQLQVGRKSRDILFGMMIADCHDSGEEEPVKPRLILDGESIRSSVRDRTDDPASLIDWRHDVDGGEESITLDFSNGGEIFIYVNGDGNVVVEGD